MIKIVKKEQCCGCSACLHICPKQSISFKDDSEGFLYPCVDLTTCINCGLCENVCPVINQNEERISEVVYAAKHPDEEIRLSSSSGGIFTLIAEKIIDQGGVVFGARFNDKWEVVHSYTDTKEGLVSFRGSKYVQSYIGNSYLQVKAFLEEDRHVMFTGTPCQVAGLKKFLRKDYEKLLTVDVVCHGVPSPKVWRDYLMNISQGRLIENVNFRNKESGWKNYQFVVKVGDDIISQPFYENLYMRGFLNDIYLRPSCYSCKVKSGRSGSDITLGDFWGIDNYFSDLDDDKGISIVLLNTSKAIANFNALDVDRYEVSYNQVLSGNPSLEQSAKCDYNIRSMYWNRNNLTEGIDYVLKKMKPSLIKKCITKFKKLILM